MHWLIILVIVALSGCGMLNRASSENLATASETELVCTKEKVIGSILRETRCVSAAQVEALEVLMKSSGPSSFDADTGGPPLTLEELREMQNDPRYFREKNPAFIKKVTEGYARLYKGQ